MIHIQMSSARAQLPVERRIVGAFGGHSVARFGSFRRATLVKMSEAAWNASPSAAAVNRILGMPTHQNGIDNASRLQSR
jgi:hypothetical protein